jgi:hypothetical protein
MALTVQWKWSRRIHNLDKKLKGLHRQQLGYGELLASLTPTWMLPREEKLKPFPRDLCQNRQG